MSLATLKTKVEQLIEKAEWEDAWYEFTNETRSFNGLFNGSLIEKLPRLSLVNATSINNLCTSMKNLKRIDFYINSKNCTSSYQVFHSCSSLEYIKGINAQSSKNVNYLFYACKALVTIEEPLDFSSATSANSTFSDATALVNVRFVSESIKISIAILSSSLSAESKQSIFDGLATVTTAQTLTLNANAKILQSQVDSANAKGWTVAGGTIVSEEEYYG